MSAGYSTLSDAEILARLGGAAPAAPAAAPSRAASMSDDELLKALGVSRPAPAGPASFDERFGDGAMSSNGLPNTPLGEGVRAKADEMLVGKPNAQNIAAAGTLSAINTAGLNLPRAVGSAIQSLPFVGNGQGYSQNYEAAKEREAAYARQAPIAAALGTGTGMVAGALALPSVRAAESANIIGRMGANAATGALYGGLGEAVDSQGDIGKTAGAAAIGGAAGAAFTPAAELAGRVISRLRTTGVPHVNADGSLTDEAVQALEAAGVNPQQVPAEVLAAFKAKGPSEAAAREGMAQKYGIDLTRGQAAGDYGAQQAESMMARTGKGGLPDEAGDTVRDFYKKQYAQVDEAKRAIGQRFAGGEDIVANPNEAADMIANRGAGEASRIGQVEARYNEQAQAALDKLRGNNPIDATDAAETARLAVKGRADQAREGYQQAYRDAFDREGDIAPEFFTGMAQRGAGNVMAPGAPQNAFAAPISDRISQSLTRRAEPIIVDPTLTPLANATLNDLNRVAELRLGRNGQPNAAEDIVGVNLRGVEQARKIIGARMKSALPGSEDARAMRGVLESFDDELERGFNSALFSGDREALPALQAARKQFREFQQTYRPRGQGDDVGSAMRAIVERDATPDQVSKFLYGSGVVDPSGKAMRVADRLETVLGAKSDEFRAIRQGYLSNVLNGSDMSHGAISERIDQALTGKGRGLAFRLLTDEQIAGLRSFQSAARTASAVREKTPEWLTDLAKGNYDPQVVATNLWGKTTVGGNAASGQYAQGLKRFFGEASPEWQAARQAVWQRLTMKSEDAVDQYGAQATVSRLDDFLNGKGRSLANAMFDESERASMREFANVMKTMVPQKIAGGSAAPNSDTAPALASMAARLQKSQNKVAAIFAGAGFLHGGVVGAVAGATAGKTVAGLGQKLMDRAAMQRAQGVIGGAQVRVRPGTSSLSDYAGALSVGAGLGAGAN